MSGTPVRVVEVSDLPEAAVGCLSVRVPAHVEPDQATVTLYLRTGFPHERLVEWIEMRIATFGQGDPPDHWNVYDEGDDLVAETLVEWVEFPDP
jgi:hypothetical protein